VEMPTRSQYKPGRLHHTDPGEMFIHMFLENPLLCSLQQGFIRVRRSFGRDALSPLFVVLAPFFVGTRVFNDSRQLRCLVFLTRNL